MCNASITRARIRIALVLLSCCASAPAVTVERMQVEREQARYTVAAVMTLAVAPEVAYRAATDYERLPAFNPIIVTSRRLDGHRLRSRIRLCVAFFCKHIDQIMRYEEHAPERIDMEVIPGAGDLKDGRARWRFTSDGQTGTRLRFDAEIEPDFWIPPLIGPYLIARELREQARVTGASIERLAADYERADAPDA